MTPWARSPSLQPAEGHNGVVDARPANAGIYLARTREELTGEGTPTLLAWRWALAAGPRSRTPTSPHRAHARTREGLDAKDAHVHDRQFCVEARHAFSANVIRVLIASPGDVVNERRLCRTVIDDWNSMHAEHGVVLIPLGWDTDATPEMGDRPQGVLNRQLVERADVLIGLSGRDSARPPGRQRRGRSRRLRSASKRASQFASTSPTRRWCPAASTSGSLSVCETLARTSRLAAMSAHSRASTSSTVS